MVCITTSKAPCDFAFNIEGEGKTFEMSGSSTINGRQVVVENFKGPVILRDQANFNVTGFSVNDAGTMQDGSGAAFVGMPGSCSPKDINNPSSIKTYGTFNMVPDHVHILHPREQMGSMGKKNQKITNGGGRIVILSDSV
jgi:hypothetical protein